MSATGTLATVSRAIGRQACAVQGQACADQRISPLQMETLGRLSRMRYRVCWSPLSVGSKPRALRFAARLTVKTEGPLCNFPRPHTNANVDTRTCLCQKRLNQSAQYRGPRRNKSKVQVGAAPYGPNTPIFYLSPTRARKAVRVKRIAEVNFLPKLVVSLHVRLLPDQLDHLFNISLRGISLPDSGCEQASERA